MNLEKTYELLSDILFCNDEFLQSRIKSISEKDSSVNFFSDYVYWNSIFAGCVVNLVSRYHLWPYIGNKPNPAEDLQWYNATSSLGNRYFHSVASYIFAAAEDEYDDKGIKVKDERVAHKDMAWFFLNEVYNFLDLDIRNRHPSNFVIEINNKTMNGYGVNQHNDIHTLFKNLGFHLGSEKLAALEFKFIHETIKTYHPQMYEHLQNKEMPNGIKAIDWIKVHGTVEEEHFNNALIGVQIILSHFEQSNIHTENVLNDLRNGFQEFYKLQKAFFNNY